MIHSQITTPQKGSSDDLRCQMGSTCSSKDGSCEISTPMGKARVLQEASLPQFFLLFSWLAQSWLQQVSSFSVDVWQIETALVACLLASFVVCLVYLVCFIVFCCCFHFILLCLFFGCCFRVFPLGLLFYLRSSLASSLASLLASGLSLYLFMFFFVCFFLRNFCLFVCLLPCLLAC